MSSDILVPSAGESVNEGEIAVWHKKDGESVDVDDVIAEIETEKASLEVCAPVKGKLIILVEEGATVTVGQKIATIAEGVAGTTKSAGSTTKQMEQAVQKVVSTQNRDGQIRSGNSYKNDPSYSSCTSSAMHASLSARKLLNEYDIEKSQIVHTEHPGRIGKQDVKMHLNHLQNQTATKDANDDFKNPSLVGDRDVTRRKMTRLRQTVAKRLTEANQTAALLTTFNEVDMSAVMEIRKKYKEKYEKMHGIKLGFMSFFVKAACDALKLFPVINSFIDGQEIVEYHYADVGIAVATKKGLIVPLLRNAEKMDFAQIEKSILDFSIRGNAGKISLDEMSGGTFTITNGGTFGSMLSTPIVNFPQSAILGMHNIVRRPVAINDQVEIRPIMYLALTYDHRLIDGSEAVRFLCAIKDRIEDPARMLVGV